MLTMSFYVYFLIEQLVLIIGTQLEHVITKMAIEFQSVAIGVPDVKSSNKLFWFKYPKFIIRVIHLIIFQVNFTFCVHMFTCTSVHCSFSYDYTRSLI